MTPDAAVNTAARVGSADVPTILALAALLLIGVVVWLSRENARLQSALVAAVTASGVDKERLLNAQLAREGAVVVALDAITELPETVRAIPDAVAAAVCTRLRDEIARAPRPR